MELLEENIIKDALKLFDFFSPEYPFGEYNPVYLFTNERLDIILGNVNLSGKLLSVNASGDQTLNAILLGARDVQMFDLNKFTKYFTSLKIWAIKNLKYEEFLRLYNIGVRKNGNFIYNVYSPRLDKEMILKVYEKLSDNYGLFFEEMKIALS